MPATYNPADHSRRYKCQYCGHTGRVSKRERARIITCACCYQPTPAHRLVKVRKPLIDNITLDTSRFEAALKRLMDAAYLAKKRAKRPDFAVWDLCGEFRHGDGKPALAFVRKVDATTAYLVSTYSPARHD